MYHYFVKGLNEITHYMSGFVNWYIIVLILLFFYELAAIFCNRLQKNELEKRKLILDEIKTYRTEKALVDEKNKGFLNNLQFLAHISQKNNEKERQQYNQKTKEIVKRHNGKPHLIVLALFIQGFILFSYFSLFREIEEIPYHHVFPVAAIILTIIGKYSKKRLIIMAIAVPIMIYFYSKMNGAIVFYLFCLVLSKKIQLLVKAIKKHHKKTKM